MSELTAGTTTYPALAPPPAPARPRVLLVGTVLASAAVAMAFAALIGTYLSLRATSDGWLPDNVTIPLSPGTMALVTLAMSIVTVHWAAYSIGNDDRPNTYVALGITMVFGLAYINSAIYLYTQMGAAIGGSVAELLIYAISGSHLALTMAALVFLALMAFRTLGGQYSGRDTEGVTAATVLWDTLVVIYAVIWYAIYVTK